jgi:hypothetical protein
MVATKPLRRRLRRTCGWCLLALVGVVAMLLPRGDRLVLSPAAEATVGFHFSLVRWELTNVASKWTARAANLFRGVSEQDGAELVRRHAALTAEIRRLETDLERSASQQAPSTAIVGLEESITRLRTERAGLRSRLEDYLESELSRTIDDEGMGGPGAFVWPPVDFRMDSPPKLLVTSPRDRIERLDDVLLGPAILVSDSERIEARILRELDRSALVEGLGGLATYPNIVPVDYDLMSLLEVAAHEWTHSYLFFRPLGQNFDASPDMLVLNETVASLAGEEIGWATWSRLTGEPAPQPHLLRERVEPGGPAAGFSFNEFMRETRGRVDELLGEGRIDEAEAYMEERRVALQAHGVFLRKLNQAYFAFHGTYADSPSSTSPVGPQVAEYRRLSTGIGELVRELAGVDSYQEFLTLLDAKRQRAAAYTLPMAPTGRGAEEMS